ncbi:Protein argonaute-3, partial [Trichinella sp. T8]
MSKESEDMNVAADELSQLRLKELVKRPGYGTVGKPIKLACNYFPLIKLQKGDIVVNRYHIDIQHPRLKLNCDDNRDIFWAYVVKRSDIFGDPFKLAYDGKSTLFTVDKLHLKPVSENADTEKFSFKTVRENKPSEVSILMKFAGLVHLDFRNAEAGFLDEREKGPIQFLDILFAQGRSSPLLELSKSFKAVRNSFYFIPQGAGVDVKYGIDLWRGLFISARVVDCFRPAINIDVSHSCFYKRQSLINLICDILNGDECEVRFHPNQLRSNTQLQPEHLSLLIPELKGVCIHTTHRNQDGIYRIKNILSTAVSMKFERDGKEVSVAEYFCDVYGPLKYPNLPLVQVGSKSKPIYFPVELCQVANCQRYNKKLKACQTTSIIRFASTDAPTRILKCIDMVKKSNFSSDPFLKSFGVQIKAEPMNVSGRVLPPPRLEYGKGNGGRQIILTPKDGAWNSTEFKFFESASCESFGFVSFLPPHKVSVLQEFCLQIVRTCRSTGIKMPDSPKFYEQARKTDTVEMVLKRIADKCDRDGIKCDLVFVALFSSEQYAQVKSCGDITLGLVTQCVLPKTISEVAIKKSYSTMLNIAMKINMKIGGINTKLLEDEVLDNYLYKNNALVIGVDVVHPSAIETHLPSIASVVGNVDTKVTKFHASVKIQPAKQELITGFIEQFSERLLEYLDVNGTAPKNIIVYRDGVSDGQFMQVLEEEVSALRRACKSVAENYRPLITFIVVQKRHHARFFCCDEAAARGRGKNIPAGTVIDRVVTSPDEYDFFLCSHHGIQGTSRPTRYHVLFDESNMDANATQSITYYLCHLYGRCARSVSIPAPVYFADLVCARARYHVLAALNSGRVEKFSDEDSNSKSSSSRSSSSKAESVERELANIIALHKRVRKVMYFA